jgi:hypothetical protein
LNLIGRSGTPDIGQQAKKNRLPLRETGFYNEVL